MTLEEFKKLEVGQVVEWREYATGRALVIIITSARVSEGYYEPFHEGVLLHDSLHEYLTVGATYNWHYLPEMGEWNMIHD